ncbi:hypothetical protein M0802_010379 [Mischocyttarus mexicanus]|nr:hypothetical protein M0802_010379 [Mischocyttarus mexicanus]
MIAIATILVSILIKFNDGSPTKIERTMISKTNLNDLESSATGYTYEQGQGYPVTYVHYTNYGNGRYYDTALPVHYVVDGSGKGAVAPVALSVPQTAAHYERPVISYANVGQKPSPYVQQRLSYVNTGKDHMASQGIYMVPKKPLAPYYMHLSNEKVVKVEDSNRGYANEKNNEDVKETKDEHEDDDEYDDDEDEDENEDDSGYNDDHKTYTSFSSKGFENNDHLGNSRRLYNKDNLGSSIEDDGSSFEINEHSSNGKKADSSHNSYDLFDDEQKKDYDSVEKTDHYDLKGGQKKEYIDKSGVYDQHDDLKKGEEGVKREHNSYYKKGEKTNGYHKVYHKDEYKKNTEFYDENHKDGQFGKHYSFDQHNNENEGDYKKKSHHDSGLDQWNKTKKDDFNKGHDVTRNQEQHSEKNEDSYHNDYSDYSKEGGKVTENKHGYSKNHDDH